LIVDGQRPRELAWLATIALGLALAVAIGAHYYNAWPSAARPFGNPGAADFGQGASMVRFELSLIASLPALALGVTALGGLGTRVEAAARIGTLGLLLVGSVLAGSVLAALAVSDAPASSILAFAAAHIVLALSFFGIGLLCGASPWPAPTAAAAGTLALLAEPLLRIQLFRGAGFHALAAGGFPDWFYASQVLPYQGYRDMLILQTPEFRDGLERAVFANAALPSWMNPLLLGGILLALWFVVPAALAVALHKEPVARRPLPFLDD
jgi:hypothetical protein